MIEQNATLTTVNQDGILCLHISIDDGRIQATVDLSSIEEGIQHVRIQEFAQKLLARIEQGEQAMKQARSETYEVDEMLYLIDDMKRLCNEQLPKEA